MPAWTSLVLAILSAVEVLVGWHKRRSERRARRREAQARTNDRARSKQFGKLLAAIRARRRASGGRGATDPDNHDASGAADNGGMRDDPYRRD